ncbi:MAG: ECF transporter S component [Anaerolineae bacterium]|nr:ECF transporter S component [Anaerolineae bacterium]MDK1117965.1 ECF transporter S component [Anaerolineae bacterium]
MTNKSIWVFGTRQVVFGAMGAAIYGVLSWTTQFLQLPAAGNVSFRPAVAVLVFFGIAYGPWVGLLAGVIGNTLGDALSGWGFFWNWSLGNGLMGLISGLAMPMINDFRARADLIKGIIWGTIGIALGMIFASLTEIFVGGINLNTAVVGYFLPAFLGNFIVILVLLPILMTAFAGVAARRGR